MLYAIALDYARPKDEVKAHLDAHRPWLAAEIEAGRILAAGPLDSGRGGFVLACAAQRDEIDAMITRDPSTSTESRPSTSWRSGPWCGRRCFRSNGHLTRA